MKNEKKVQIKMLGNVRKYNAGDVVEVSEAEARELLGLGYAVVEIAPDGAKE